MSDKAASEKKLSEKNAADKQEIAKNNSNIADDSSAKKSSIAQEKNTTEKADVVTSNAKLTNNDKKTAAKAKVNKPAKANKTAIAAIVLASVSILSSVGFAVWQQQQTTQQVVNQQENLQQSQAQLKRNLTTEFNRQLQQQNHLTNQSQQSAKQAHIDSDAQLKALAAQVTQLEQHVQQRQPSDWLIHEAEYLVRVAARTMWLERDTTAAISLLRDADSRLKELNQPKFLAVRALINEDIEALALMPTLQNQEAILTLMALNKQIPTLELAGANLAQAIDDTKEDFTLSNDVADWQENLAKTWQKFLNDFITVRRRTGMAEPLMTPDQQQHLRQNLSLKVQLVQWAASEQKQEIYQQTLLDIQQWLNEFFDMELAVNQKFYQAIEQLKLQTIYYDYPSDLRSLSAIKRLLNDSKNAAKPAQKDSINEKAPTTETTEPKQQEIPVDESTESQEASGGQL